VRQSYSIDAVNEFDPLFEDLYAYAEAQRLDVETLIHEAGAAQMEINFLHGDPLEVADQVVLFKRTVREVAMRHKIYATFMAKPMAGEPGSAMHLHQSLVDRKTGRNLFAAQESERDPRFFSYIAGLQHHMGAAMPFYAPYVNSYRRVVRDSFVPINAHWGYDNRTVGLRVPLSSPQSTRIENRLAGADVNPYLAIAASLACGYLGMRDNLPATGAVQGSAYELPHQLPRNLEDALHLLQEDEDLREILGERFVTVFCAIKASEHEAFFRVISSWEREYLLLNV
jgi:glutamine synthetase